MLMSSNYDQFPYADIPIFGAAWRGWDDICRHLGGEIKARPGCVIAVECYTGLHNSEVAGKLRHALDADSWVSTEEVFLPVSEIEARLAPYLGGDDPLFGFLSPLTLDSFLDASKLAALRQRIAATEGPIVVYGTGALLCCEPDLIVYADMPRWEGQLRQRRGEVSNLGVTNQGLKASLQYKQSFFVDWRVCDRLKQATLARWDFLLDTTVPGDPKLVTGDALRAGLDLTAQRPFRVVPFFDPAPWGGQWMKEVCGLDPSAVNYGWCFDCVPEENSLCLRFGEITVEMPALNLVFYRPLALLGEAVFREFGPEFPIRFDLLDTIGGGNLSLQVHPPALYARDHFGLHYTQDESYYILDAGAGASVFLGFSTPVDALPLLAALEAAQEGGKAPDIDKFVAHWPAQRHDHFLIPAGTIHCSGAETVVLEISATPYIFTFKLWDWGRRGLDGLPRPINLRRGRESLEAERDTDWTKNNLINQVTPLAQGEEWREERTGLHDSEFIETRRHWFTGPVPHDTRGTVHVLNLVAGAEAIVESPSHVFSPFIVHYAETFILPAAVGHYTIRPHGAAIGTECATVQAFVREAAA
jgi:hypothetical protein